MEMLVIKSINHIKPKIKVILLEKFIIKSKRDKMNVNNFVQIVVLYDEVSVRYLKFLISS